MAKNAGFWKRYDVNVEAGTIEIELVNGATYTLDVNAQSAGNRTAAMWHGFTQKIRDAAAAMTTATDESGKKIARSEADVLADKLAGVAAVIETLQKGVGDITSWNARSGSGDKERGGLDVMVDALMAYYENAGKTPTAEKIREKLKAMSQKARVALVTQPSVLPFYQMASGTSTVDVDTLLD